MHGAAVLLSSWNNKKKFAGSARIQQLTYMRLTDVTMLSAGSGKDCYSGTCFIKTFYLETGTNIHPQINVHVVENVTSKCKIISSCNIIKKVAILYITI